ncbi:MAG: NAD-dependent epimerase/dehydratase family protein [Lachnospiraceae bacterium]|nr:NAD-dependent epimerase/dehydratase family protein [Lachnospiraceae bacterium]
MSKTNTYTEIIDTLAQNVMEDVLSRTQYPYEKISFLITGAYGMVGRVLVDLLMRLNDRYQLQNHIYGFGRNAQKAANAFSAYENREDFTYINGDITQGLPELGNMTYMIHAASNTHPLEYSKDPIGTIWTNVKGLENLLNYGISHQVRRLAFISSVEIYGENTSSKDSFSEKEMGYIDCNQLRAGYPESKRLGEALCCAYGKQYQLDFVIPRLCRSYGPTVGKDDSKALSQFMNNALKGEDIVLKSEGKQFYSYMDVFDAVKGLCYIFFLGEAGGAYNIADESQDITLKDLASLCAEYAGGHVIFDLPKEDERQGFSKATKAILDSGKLKKLGWKPDYDIRQGLRISLDLLARKEMEQKRDGKVGEQA